MKHTKKSEIFESDAIGHIMDVGIKVYRMRDSSLHDRNKVQY